MWRVIPNGHKKINPKAYFFNVSKNEIIPRARKNPIIVPIPVAKNV